VELLRARVNFSEKTVHFSGPGTFSAKEQIKSLGAARWNSQLKCWDVRMVVVSLEELRARFPQAQFELEGEPPAGSMLVEQNAEGQSVLAPTVMAPKLLDASALPASLGVSELLAQFRAALQSAFPTRIYLRGVISKVKRHDSWTYLDLVDELQRDTKLECVIRSADGDVEKSLRDAGFQLEEDLQVMCGVLVGMRTKAGVVSLRITEFVPEYTLGKLAAERDKTNERLKKEGLFEKNRQLRMAFLPQRLGVLTSAKGTVIHDFLASLKEARFGFQLYLCHVNVQGAEARESILDGFAKLEQLSLDAILIMRGGGSPAELAVFNDYELAKRVCSAKVPVVAAIGHQEDQSSVQDVSFRACGVPKDVGRYFADIVVNIKRKFGESLAGIQRESQRMTERVTREVDLQQQLLVGRACSIVALYEQRLKGWSEQLPKETRRRLGEGTKNLSVLSDRLSAAARGVVERLAIRLQPFSQLPRAMANFLERTEERLMGQERLISAASPANQLARGFAIVRSATDGAILTHGERLASGQEVQIEFQDAHAEARITAVAASAKTFIGTME